MKLFYEVVRWNKFLSPPARGRGLKLQKKQKKGNACCRPPHGGVD